jgi:hypothetical protein
MEEFTTQNSIDLGDSLNFDKKQFKIKNKILIEPDMFYSGPFKALSASAIRTLMRCLQKRKWNKVKGSNGKKKIVYVNDGFIFPYIEATFLGIGTTQHSNNIRKLVELGFLDIVHQGGWYQKNKRTREQENKRTREQENKRTREQENKRTREQEITPSTNYLTAGNFTIPSTGCRSKNPRCLIQNSISGKILRSKNHEQLH